MRRTDNGFAAFTPTRPGRRTRPDNWSKQLPDRSRNTGNRLTRFLVADWDHIARLFKCSPAQTLLAKMHASLGLFRLCAPCLCSPGRATAAHRQRDRFDAALGLFEQLAHAGIIDPAFRRYR